MYNLKRSSDLFIMKNFCAISFSWQITSILNHHFKYLIFIDHHFVHHATFVRDFLTCSVSFKVPSGCHGADVSMTPTWGSVKRKYMYISLGSPNCYTVELWHSYLIAHIPFEISPVSIAKPAKSAEDPSKLPNLSIPHVNVTKNSVLKVINRKGTFDSMLDSFSIKILDTWTVYDFLHAHWTNEEHDQELNNMRLCGLSILFNGFVNYK